MGAQMVHISFACQIFPSCTIVSGDLEFAGPSSPATGYVILSDASRVLGVKVYFYAGSKWSPEKNKKCNTDTYYTCSE